MEPFIYFGNGILRTLAYLELEAYLESEATVKPFAETPT